MFVHISFPSVSTVIVATVELILKNNLAFIEGEV